MAKSSTKSSTKSNEKPKKYVSEEIIRDSSPSSASSTSSESEEAAAEPEVEAEAPNKESSDVHPVSFEFKAPQGYSVVNSTFDSPFSDEKLAGKQIFHITAPSSIHLLKNGRALKMNPGQNGSTFILGSDKDVSYTVRKTSGADAGNLGMFVPLRGKAGYKLSKTSIAAHYTITEAPPIQKLTANNTRPKAVKSRRAQPEGLKMRFKPAGWDSDSDEEPITDGGNVHEKKSVDKDNDVDMLNTAQHVVTAEPPKKKHKSKQTPVIQEDEDMENVQQEQPTIEVPSKTVVPEKREDETKEERQLRRELKKKDKEEKRKRKGKA